MAQAWHESSCNGARKVIVSVNGLPSNQSCKIELSFEKIETRRKLSRQKIGCNKFLELNKCSTAVMVGLKLKLTKTFTNIHKIDTKISQYCQQSQIYKIEKLKLAVKCTADVTSCWNWMSARPQSGWVWNWHWQRHSLKFTKLSQKIWKHFHSNIRCIRLIFQRKI